MRLPGALAGAVVLVLAHVLAGCGGGDGGSVGDRTLHVLAAASLTSTFDELAETFEAEHDGVAVRAVYDSSGTLVTQVAEGAPADVLATADLVTMQRAVGAGSVTDPTTFAGNSAVLVTPAGNPAGITAFADLDRAGVDYVVCVDTAPCGSIGAALLAANAIEREPASLEDNVRGVLEKVVSGEADAGIVYATDALAAGRDVAALEVPGAAQHVTGYGIGVVEQSGDPVLARAFVDLVLSVRGQEVLRDAGFVEAP